MEPVYLLIDGGTTNTRFTLMQDDRLLERVMVRIGAASADAAHRNQGLRDAVRETIAALEAKHHVQIDRIMVSGMITSENGLVCVPHLTAPAGLEELAAGVREITLPDISDKPLCFIPGVKTIAEDGAMDMMRGEEAELMGDLAANPCAGTRLYLHFGSHNKAILVQQGKIVRSSTAMSGELLAAVMEHTILTSSVGTAHEFQFDPTYAAAGFAEAQQKGMTGTLFSARLHAVLQGADAAQVRSFLYGAFTQQDAQCFAPMLELEPEEIVLYGRRQFADAWLICMQSALRGKTRILSYEESEYLSVSGAIAVMKTRNGGSESHE